MLFRRRFAQQGKVGRFETYEVMSPLSAATGMNGDNVAFNCSVTVYYGDVFNPDLLRRVGLLAAKALVVTIDDRAQADGLVIAARAMRPDLLIVVRARDARHAAHLYGLGATDAVPETIEASLQLSEAVLVDLRVPMGLAIASIHDKRAEFQAEIRAMAPGATIRPRERRRLRDVRRVSDA